MKARAQYNLSSDWIEILLYTDTDNGRAVVTELTLTPHTEGTYMKPSLQLNPMEAQQLIDELWRCGLRPKNGQGGPAQVEAMKDHLTDLQRIVFKNYP